MQHTSIPTESLKFTEARPKLSSILDRVFRRQTRIRLYKGSTPVAAIVSIGDLERLESLDAAHAATTDSNMAASQDPADISEEQLEQQIYEIVARVRREMWAERSTAENHR